MWVSLRRVSAQLGAVLLWRGGTSASLMLAAWSHQTRAAGDRKRYIFSRNSERALGSLCGLCLSTVSARN